MFFSYIFLKSYADSFSQIDSLNWICYQFDHFLFKTFDTIWFRTENLFYLFSTVSSDILPFYLLVGKLKTKSSYYFISSIISCCWSNLIENFKIETNSQWTHFRRFAIDSTLKFHVENSSRFHRLWKENPRGNYDIDSVWKFRRVFDFENRRNIDEFSTWIFLCCFDVELT